MLGRVCYRDAMSGGNYLKKKAGMVYHPTHIQHKDCVNMAALLLTTRLIVMKCHQLKYTEK